MQGKDIKDGETYLFVATDNPARKHLEGTAFTVQSHKAVWRKNKGKATRKRNRYFNDDGIGARAEELEPLPERESPCSDCVTGEMKTEGFTQPNGTQYYKCDVCGKEESFP